MNDITALTTLISALRTETRENSISPERVGNLLQKLADLIRGCATDSEVVPGGTTPSDAATKEELDALRDVAIKDIAPTVNRTAAAFNIVATLTEADGQTRQVTLALPMATALLAGLLSGSDYSRIINAIENMAVLGEDAYFDVVKMNQLGLIAEPVLKAYIKELVAEVVSATSMTTENLTVTKAAHFFKLVIDELAASKGAIIITAANCKADIVVSGSGYYDVYFRASDADGAAIINTWKVGDLAICMAFNGLHTGINNNVSNKYYWRKVTAVASDVTRDGVLYHRMRLSDLSTGKDPACNGVPEAGDEIVQLGYTGTDDTARQSAIILSAYTTPDTDLVPPSLAFYRGINDFSLSTHRKTFFDATRNTLVGSMKVGADEVDIETFVDGKTKYTHFAWSDDPTDDDPASYSASSDGGSWSYIGVCVTTEATAPAVPQHRDLYDWTYIRGAQGARGGTGAPGNDGEDGADAENWKLVPVSRTLTALADGRVRVNLLYTVVHIKGASAEVLDGNAQYNAGIAASYRRELVNGTSSAYSDIQVGQSETDVAITGTYAASNQNWNKDTLAGVRVRLTKGGSEVAADFVPLTLLAGAAFEVIQAGCDSYIQSHVQGTYALQSALDATNQVVSNNQSTVTQRMDSIASRVSTTETNYDTLSGEVESVQSSVTEIEQQADSISMEVRQQSAVNENYFRNASLSSLDWIDRAWTRDYNASAVASALMGHIWRYCSLTSTNMLDSTARRSAILSSYIARAAGGVPSAASITQTINVVSGNTYTISVWVRKVSYYGQRAFGIGGTNFSVVNAKVYHDASGSNVEDSSVTVTRHDSDRYAEFSPAASDTEWKLLVLVVQATSASMSVWMRTWGSDLGYTDWQVSRPCIRLGDGTSVVSARTYNSSTSTNLFSNSTLASSAAVQAWGCYASITVDDTAYQYSWNGSEVTLDTLSPYILARLWNTGQWTDSLLMGSSIAAVVFSSSSAVRSSHTMALRQDFTASVGASLYGKTLCFSAYIKRAVKWGGEAYNTGNTTAIATYGLGIVGTNIASISAYKADDASKVSVVSPSSYTEGGASWQMVRFAPSDDAWHRVWMVFSLAAGAQSAGFTLGFRNNIVSGVADDWVITKPKLEVGEAPTAWVDYTGEEIKSGLTRTGIDIEAGKIRLDAYTVEVAKDLTIGGNTRIGGFIYNLQGRLKPAQVHRCYNPLEYGNIDYRALSGTGTLPEVFLTNNVLFPECGSSILIDDAVASCFGAQSAMLNRINICLPFYHHYAMPGTVQSMDNMYSLCSDYTSLAGYGSLGDVPEITGSETSALMCTKFLVEQIGNARDTCRRYLGSTVTIENRMAGITGDDRFIAVFGVKGLASTEGAEVVGNNAEKRWYAFEPWNRGTIAWTLADYYSGSYATKRWISGNCIPKDDEARRVIDRVLYSFVDYNTGVINNSGSYIKTTRDYFGDSVWAMANAVVEDRSYLYDSNFYSSLGLYGYTDPDYVNNAGQLPFVVPSGYFCRLRLVYEDGWFFWDIEAFGPII